MKFWFVISFVVFATICHGMEHAEKSTPSLQQSKGASQAEIENKRHTLKEFLQNEIFAQFSNLQSQYEKEGESLFTAPLTAAALDQQFSHLCWRITQKIFELQRALKV